MEQPDIFQLEIDLTLGLLLCHELKKDQVVCGLYTDVTHKGLSYLLKVVHPHARHKIKEAQGRVRAVLLSLKEK